MLNWVMNCTQVTPSALLGVGRLFRMGLARSVLRVIATRGDLS